MKKLISSLIIIVISFSTLKVFAQTNIFPTSGNVGIGTTTPYINSKLHIFGGHGNTSSLLELPASANGNNTGAISLNTWVSEPNISWEGTGIGANINNWGLMRFNNSMSSSYIRFSPHPTNGYMLFSTITGTGIKHENVMAIVNNMVGIGTTSPSRKFEVVSETSDIAYFRDNSTASEVVLRGNPTNTIFDFGNRPLQVQFNSVPSFTMNTLGNMGIGTVSPTEKLEVNGNVQISGTIKYGNAGVRTEYRDNAGLQGNTGALSGFFETYAPQNFPKDDNNWWHLIDTRHSNPTNNYAMQLAGSFFDQKLYFRKTDNSPTQPWREVITADPSGEMTIGKSDYTGGSLFLGNANHGIKRGYTVNGNDVGLFTTSGDLYLSTTNSIPQFVLKNNGNVGIGTTIPAYKLTVAGTIYSDNAMFDNELPLYGYGARVAAYGQNGDVGFAIKREVNTPSSWWIRTPNGSTDLDFFNGGTAMKITASGSVGINAPNIPAGYKLAVGGDVIAERVVVKLTGNWPDYVFSPNYKRTSLLEIEEFINKNHHLPNIPSAKEVAENGVDVGKMNAKLLEKMEEMTLYMIEQQKEIKALREEVKQIKDKK